MADAPGLLRYVRDCYRTDHRGSAVLDVFANAISHRHVFEGEERLASGELPDARPRSTGASARSSTG